MILGIRPYVMTFHHWTLTRTNCQEHVRFGKFILGGAASMWGESVDTSDLMQVSLLFSWSEFAGSVSLID